MARQSRHWVQPLLPGFALEPSGAAALTLSVDSWQWWSTDLMLSAVTANFACLNKVGSRLSASLMGTLLHDRAASALIGLSVLTAKLVREQTKLFHSLLCFFPPMDYAGGICRLWLWEQAPRSYSFSSCLYEGRSPALTLYLHFTKNWKNVLKTATTPFWALLHSCYLF